MKLAKTFLYKMVRLFFWTRLGRDGRSQALEGNLGQGEVEVEVRLRKDT